MTRQLVDHQSGRLRWIGQTTSGPCFAPESVVAGPIGRIVATRRCEARSSGTLRVQITVVTVRRTVGPSEAGPGPIRAVAVYEGRLQTIGLFGANEVSTKNQVRVERSETRSHETTNPMRVERSETPSQTKKLRWTNQVPRSEHSPLWPVLEGRAKRDTKPDEF
jgi:hypothetical protein